MKFNKSSLLSTLVFSVALSLAGPITTLAAGPAAVDLLSITTNSFVLLSKTGITNTGSHTSIITGNIGSSPITAAAMDNVFCSEITGTIYGVDAAYTGSGSVTCFAGNPPLANKTLVDNAVLDMGTAYVDAAGRTGPDATELGAGNIGGMTLAPGLYKWSTDVTIPTNVTLSGGANDVWIFQIAGNLDIASAGSIPAGIKVLLSGGAVASNVFWQVGGVTGATLGTYSTFNGVILSSKQTIIQTGAVLNGRALAQTQITLDANPVTLPTVSPPPPPAPAPAPSPAPSFTGQSTNPPLISVTNVPTPLSLPNGPGSVTYNYSVSNIGTAPMTNVTVSDNKCASVSFVSGDTNNNSVLDQGEAWKYRCAMTVSQTLTNTVTASGKANGLTATDTANATVAVSVKLPAPLIHLVKKPSALILPVGGGVVTYTYTVTNPGTAPLSKLTITDDKCTNVSGRTGDLNNNNLLESNESWTFTCQSNLIETTTNTGTVEGSANGMIATDFARATVIVTTPGLPNTGNTPSELAKKIALVVGILVVVSAAAVLILKKWVL